MVSYGRSILLFLLLAAAHSEAWSSLDNLCDRVSQPEPIKVKEKLLQRAILSKLFNKPQYINVSVSDTDLQFQSAPVVPVDTINGLPKRQECPTIRTDAQVCQWVYRCDTDERRIPQTLFHAELSSERASQDMVFVHRESGEWLECSCKPVTAPLSLLRFHDCVEGKEEWRWEMEQITVAFVCAFHI